MARKAYKYYIRIGYDHVLVPHWARWMAQDRSGLWFFYEYKPNKHDLMDWWRPAGKGTFCNAGSSASVTKWTEQLYRIVRAA